MKKRIPFRKLKLWWPALQLGIPVTGYGYPGKSMGTVKAIGEDYEFYVHVDYDCWVTEEGLKIPVSEASLEISPIPPYLVQPVRALRDVTFSLVDGNRVQVNTRIKGENGYQVEMFNPEDLYIVGEAFEDDD